MRLSKGITVAYVTDGFDSSRPWWVMDGGFCYSRYTTEEEAQSIAATLVAQDDRDLRIELDFNEFVAATAERYKLSEDSIKDGLALLLEVY